MKTKQSIFAILSAILLMIPVSVSARDMIEHRPVEPFDGVEASGIFRVFLTQSDTFSLTVKAPEEHMPYIETTVSDGVLSIEYSRRARNLRGLEVHVGAPAFTMLNAGGATSFESTNTLTATALNVKVSGASSMNLSVICDQLTSRVSGASNMRLSGEAVFHELIASGVSGVRAYELETNVTEATSSGTSSIRITVYESLTANASGTSDIIVRGNPPASTVSTSGTASVRGVRTTPPREERVPEKENDTLVITVGQREVVVIDGRKPQIITRRTKAFWRDEWTGFYIGVNGYMTPERSLTLPVSDQYMDLEYNNSIQVNLNLWQQNLPIARGAKSGLGLITGIGVSWNNYRFSDNIRLVHEPDHLDYYTDTIHSFRKNKLTVSHLNVPLMLEFQTRQRNGMSPFHMSVGVNAGLRLRSHTKQVYRFDGSRQKDKDYKDFHLSPFRYEAIARLGWGRINLFATYALNDMFRDDKGPELTPFSVGIRVLNF